MKIIKDIRLYRSEERNERGSFLTSSFAGKALNAVIHRIVMKLREAEFSMGDFDHLYVNFTTCEVPQSIMLSETVDRYHPWYRYCTVRIDRVLYSRLGTAEAIQDIVGLLTEVLITCFTTEAFDAEKLQSCIDQVVEQGEKMRMVFKTKTAAKRKVTVYLRYLDSCRYRPLLQVTDLEDHLLLQRDLPEAVTLDYLGEIQLSAKKVTIKPRKNAFTAQRKPIIIEY